MNHNILSTIEDSVLRKYVIEYDWLTYVFHKVLIYNGQYDIILAGPMCERFLRTLEWKGTAEYLSADKIIWNVDSEVHICVAFFPPRLYCSFPFLCWMDGVYLRKGIHEGLRALYSYLICLHRLSPHCLLSSLFCLSSCSINRPRATCEGHWT